MNRSSMLSLTAVGLLGFCAVGTAQADETLKYRSVTHVVSVQSQDVGDADGHTVFLARLSGLALFPDGSVGTTHSVTVTDYTKGAGPAVLVYNNLTFNDGSALWFKDTGTVTNDGTKALLHGTGTVTGGTGRYAGAKGDVTFTGARVGPPAGGTDVYLDWVINVKK